MISPALVDMDINYEKFVKIFKQKNKYEKMKENVQNVSEREENMRLNSVNSRK